MLMICVYVLISLKDNNRYIGSTDNLERRFDQHCNGFIQSTRNRRQLMIKYVQEFENLTKARSAEKNYKKSRGFFDRAVKNSLLKKFGV